MGTTIVTQQPFHFNCDAFNAKEVLIHKLLEQRKDENHCSESCELSKSSTEGHPWLIEQYIS
jgi:hypothetical protein